MSAATLSRTLISTAVVSMLSAAAWAQSDTTPQKKEASAKTAEAASDLPAITVTSNRMRAQSDVVGSEEVKVREAQSIGDVLKGVPGVQVGNPSSVGQRFKIRGLDDRFLGVTVDGARQQGFHYHHGGGYGVDPEMLKQVDIDVGNNSIAYDAGSLGGTMKFETMDASDLLTPGHTFGGKAKAGYASNGKEYQGALTAFGRVADRLDLLGTINYRNIDKYKAGKLNGQHESIPSDGHLTNYLLKGRFDIDKDQYFKLSAENYSNSAETGNKLNFGANVNEGRDPGFYAIDRKTFTAGYAYNPSGNDFINLRADVYRTEQESGSKVVTKVPNSNEDDFSTKSATYGLKLRNRSTFQTGSANHLLLAGYEFFDNKSTISGLRKKTIYDGAQVEAGKSHSIYLEDNIQINQFTLTPGIRWDNYQYDGVDGSMDSHYRKTYKRISKALAARYDITPDVAAFASYTELFRGPMGREIAQFDRYNVASNLRATTGANKEIGVTTSFSGLAGKDHLRFTAKYFQTDFKNFVMDNSIKGRMLSNIPKARIDGVELSGSYHNGGFKANAGVSTVKNRIRESSDRFTAGYEFQPSIGNSLLLGASYLFTSSAVELGFNSRFYDKKSATADSSKGPSHVTKRGYGVTDIYAMWAPRSGAMKGGELIFGIDNVFDKHYHDHSYYLGTSAGVAEKGRNVKLTFSYWF